MCKNNNSWFKNITGGRVMTFLVGILILTQIVLIVDVIFIVNRESNYKPIQTDIINFSLQTDIVNDSIVSNASNDFEMLPEAIEKAAVIAAKRVVNDELKKAINTAVENNVIESKKNSESGFSAIMLAMITLCVTLAVVIPYVIGKAITQNDIRNVVHEHNKQFDNRIDEAVKKLEWSEAHFSRMTAYFLLNKNENNPDWVIGWASKSLIRYLNQDSPQPWTDNFCRNCLKYISEGIGEFGKISNIDDNRKIRAIKDAYDAVCMMVAKSNIFKSDIKDRKQIIDGIKIMFNSLVADNKHNKKEIAEQIAMASKYKLYMGNKATTSDFEDKFLTDMNA